MTITTTMRAKLLAGALVFGLALGAGVKPIQAQSVTGSTYYPSTTPTTPTTPPPVVTREPPPTITTPTPPPRMVRDPLVDLRDINPVGRAVTADTPATPRRAALNRLENRLTTPRAAEQASTASARPGAKPQARDLLESAKPIL